MKVAAVQVRLAYLEFGVWVEDHLCQVGDGTIVHHGLGLLRRVLGDVAEGGSCDAFEGHLRLQETQHQQGDSTRVHHRLGQRCTVIEKRWDECVQMQVLEGGSAASQDKE